MRAHPLADPEKGSGIAMICTFGDTADVMWWRELDLPGALDRSAGTAGCSPTPPLLGGEVWSTPRSTRTPTLAGKTVKQAQQQHRRAAAASRATCSATRSRSRTR